jgi:cell division septal protein FtsQ
VTAARARRRGRARRIRIPRDLGRPLAAIVAGLAIAGLGVALSGSYPIRDVEIVGASRVDPAIVQQAARLNGVSIFWAGTHGAEERVASIPSVRRARVTIQLPDRAVIEIEERRPAIVVSAPNGKLFADESGLLFAAGGATSGLATLEDEGATRSPGARIDPMLVAATTQIATREPAYFGRAIEHIRLTGAYGLVVALTGGTDIRLGTPDQIDVKLETARQIVVARAGKRLEYVDVRNRENPVFFPIN